MLDRSISIVVPAYNEESRLPRTLDTLEEWLRDCSSDLDVEVVIVDDGSTDGTGRLLAERQDRWNRLVVLSLAEHRGKGAALAAGFDAARHDVVVFLDADLPVPRGTVESLIGGLAAAPLVVGSRRLPASHVEPPQPLVRRLGGRWFLTASRLLGYRVPSDPQCGVKALDRAALGGLVEACTIERFGFDIELIERVRRADLPVAELAISWTHVPGSTLRPVRDGVRTLVDLVRLRAHLGRA